MFDFLCDKDQAASLDVSTADLLQEIKTIFIDVPGRIFDTANPR
jgi:hypothetical protein